MELIASVAIGLNPYIGVFVLAALAAFTAHVPQGMLVEVASVPLLGAVAALYGLAAPVDFVLGKFVRFAPSVRRMSQLVAPFSGAFAAVSLTDSGLPLPLVAAFGAAMSWAVAAMLTSTSARASRSPSWIGLGHIPILMAAATAAACILPLALAKPAIGYVLSYLTLATLLGSTLLALRGSLRTRTAGGVARRAAVVARY